jgi:hypothetical protein
VPPDCFFQICLIFVVGSAVILNDLRPLASFSRPLRSNSRSHRLRWMWAVLQRCVIVLCALGFVAAVVFGAGAATAMAKEPCAQHQMSGDHSKTSHKVDDAAGAMVCCAVMAVEIPARAEGAASSVPPKRTAFWETVSTLSGRSPRPDLTPPRLTA